MFLASAAFLALPEPGSGLPASSSPNPEAKGEITDHELKLLKYFLDHAERVITREKLLTDVWGYRYTGGTRTVDVHVRRLREKLPVLADGLVTVKQFGYKLVDPGA